MQVLKKISMYIQEQNENIYAPRGLLITDPIERGMRVVSFTYLSSYLIESIKGLNFMQAASVSQWTEMKRMYYAHLVD